MLTTRSAYLPVVRQPTRFAGHGKEALDESMESDSERTIFFIHKRGDSARNGLSVAHDESRAGEQRSAVQAYCPRRQRKHIKHVRPG
jgi:hypothetical protein